MDNRIYCIKVFILINTWVTLFEQKCYRCSHMDERAKRAILFFYSGLAKNKVSVCEIESDQNICIVFNDTLRSGSWM